MILPEEVLVTLAVAAYAEVMFETLSPCRVTKSPTAKLLPTPEFGGSEIVTIVGTVVYPEPGLVIL